MVDLSRIRLHLALLALIVALPAMSQDRAALDGSFGDAVTLEGAAVPYAVRANALVDCLASLHAEDQREGTERVPSFLRSIGFEPASAAARELLELAIGLERDHPTVNGEVARRAYAKGVDLTAPGGRLDRRYAAVGSALGQWTRSRQAEGWAVEPLLDRLLNGSHLQLRLFSTEDESAFMATVGRQRAAFQRTFVDQLGHLPQRFEQ